MVLLLARDFGVEAAETKGKCLERRQGILVIHGEGILPHFPKLEDNFLTITSNQLKVLHRRNCHSPVEVEAPALQLLVPSGSLVFQDKRFFCIRRPCYPMEAIRAR